MKLLSLDQNIHRTIFASHRQTKDSSGCSLGSTRGNISEKEKPGQPEVYSCTQSYTTFLKSALELTRSPGAPLEPDFF